MTQSDALLHHKDLTDKIKIANHEYYTLTSPTLTDDEYDKLVKELKEIESKYPELQSKISSQVGAPGTGAKVKHLRPMLSLDNVFTVEELRKFFKTAYVLSCEPKIDGLSLSLIYQDGQLVRAVTRGDGKEGDDVTHNAMVIPSIPKSITFKGQLEVRGEAYISKTDFLELVAEMEKEGDEPFANARNAAAGSLKLKDSSEASKRKLSFIAYHSFGLDTTNQSVCCSILHDLGFKVTTPEGFRSDNITAEMLEDLDVRRKRLNYDTDGIVFKIHQFSVREEMGSGSKSPRWAVAYKFPPEEGIATLWEVKLQVGRTGTINPVAVLSAVQLNGASVTRASLCNYDEIKRLDIAIGDSVVVVRAAEVIPKVIRVKAKAVNRQEIKPPYTCPSCGALTTKDPVLVAYRCPNFAGCKAQAVERIAHAVSKTCLDWDGFGSSQVEDFVGRGFTTLSSIIEIADVDWLKPAAKKKFLSERERIKGVPLWRKLHALGLDGIGKSFCQDLAFKYSSILKIVEDYQGVVNIVGPNRAEKMFAQIEKMADELQLLELVGYQLEEIKKETRQTSATGKTFVITGTLVTGSREAVSEKIEAAGGVVKSSVGKTTNYLVVGENPGNNKTASATKHGTKIISEEDLYRILEIDFQVASNPLDGVNVDDL